MIASIASRNTGTACAARYGPLIASGATHRKPSAREAEPGTTRSTISSSVITIPSARPSSMGAAKMPNDTPSRASARRTTGRSR